MKLSLTKLQNSIINQWQHCPKWAPISSRQFLASQEQSNPTQGQEDLHLPEASPDKLGADKLANHCEN